MVDLLTNAMNVLSDLYSLASLMGVRLIEEDGHGHRGHQGMQLIVSMVAVMTTIG